MPFLKFNNITLRTAKQSYTSYIATYIIIAIHQTKEPSQKDNRAGS